MIPKNINRNHLEKAIEEIDREGVRKGRHSSTYDLVYNGKSYPPKLVLSIANRFANGSELNANDFGGGNDTPAFELLKKEGFEIVEKSKSTDYKIVNEYISKVKSGEINAADSIKNLVASNSFEDRLHQIDQMFFNNKLREINTTNYTETIEYIREVHAINGEYNEIA